MANPTFSAKAGRKTEVGVRISTISPPSIVELLRALAVKNHMSQSTAFNMLVEEGLRVAAAKDYERLKPLSQVEIVEIQTRLSLLS